MPPPDLLTGDVSTVVRRWATPGFTVQVPSLGIEVRGRDAAIAWLERSKLVPARLDLEVIGAFAIQVEEASAGTERPPRCHVLELDDEGVRCWSVLGAADDRSGPNLGSDPRDTATPEPFTVVGRGPDGRAEAEQRGEDLMAADVEEEILLAGPDGALYLVPVAALADYRLSDDEAEDVVGSVSAGATEPAAEVVGYADGSMKPTSGSAGGRPRLPGTGPSPDGYTYQKVVANTRGGPRTIYVPIAGLGIV